MQGSPATGVTRLARACVVTGLILLLSMAAHVVGGGHPPPAAGLVACGLPVVGVCVALARRQLGVLSLTSALGLGQVALHMVFAWVEAPAGSCRPAPTGAHAHHDAAAFTPCGADRAAEGLAGAAGGLSVLPSMTMVAAHVLVSVLLALVLAAGERGLWNLWSAWLRPALAAMELAGTPLPAPGRVPLPAQRATPIPQGVVLRGEPQRGPPPGDSRTRSAGVLIGS